MGTIKIDKVISVSSEDPAHPAENLLNSDSSRPKKWKSKSVGERSIVAVLQLDKATVINGIDVGNENSAFIEVLVGKSCLPDDEFKVLLVASSLMTMKEAKDCVNGNSVRFFKESDFCKPEATDKWDRIKIVCSQPYNKHVQYGLSFINFHSPVPVKQENMEGPSLGIFKLKISPEREVSLGKFNFKNSQDDEIAVGSIFARRKELEESTSPSATAASIRAASADIIKKADNSSNYGSPAINKVKNKREAKKRLEPDDGPSPNRKKARPGSADDIAAVGQSPNPKTPARVAPNHAAVAPSPNPKTPARVGPSQTEAKKAPSKAATNSPRIKRKLKAFEKMFEGVVFVISGFQNPLRGEIRGKALEMGAKYKADWDQTCTHLICAFPNTPKFNQVRGLGKIVKKEWIEESYSRRTRLPWRRFAMEKSAMQHPESEEEIYEETNEVRLDNRRNVGSDDEIEEPSLFPMRNKRVKKENSRPVVNLPSTSKAESKVELPSGSSENISKEESSQPSCSNFPSQSTDQGSLPQDDHNSTDSDPEWNDKLDQSYKLPYLPEQFKDLVFFVSNDFDGDTEEQIKRYIISHAGTIAKEMDENVEYVIAEKPMTLATLKKKWPQIIGVRAEWIWRCHDENRLLPTSKFEVETL